MLLYLGGKWINGSSRACAGMTELRHISELVR